MQRFTLVLKDNTQKAFYSFFWFLFFLQVIAVILFKGTVSYQTYVTLTFFFLMTLLLFSYPYFKDKIKLLIYYRLIPLIMIGFWVASFAWFPAIVLLIVIIFANFVLIRKSKAIFSTENIIIERSLFKITYKWPEIENAVLKDHLLSIDFKNNRLIQIEIAPESYDTDETSFNQFCRQQP